MTKEKMKIEFENTYKKSYLELLPSISIYRRFGEVAIAFGWLFFSVIIHNQK